MEKGPLIIWYSSPSYTEQNLYPANLHIYISI